MSGNNEELFTDSSSVEDYVKDVMMCVRNCQKLSSELAGWHHYRDYSGVERTMDQVNGLLTSLVSNIFKHQDIKIGLSRHKLLDQFDMLREGNDSLLERINSDVDEASGLKKNADAELLQPSQVKVVQGPSRMVSGRNMVLLASRSVQKPQVFFAQKVDNSHKRPFLPLLEEKPNNMKPLAILLCVDDGGNEYYSHPYEYEIEHWNPKPAQLEPVIPKPPSLVSDTPIVMVNTEEDMAKMVSELKECSEFGFDVEHHSYRTYQGLTCLIQISTREIDYIVDPLALRGKLTILNEVFTDPKITKVAHGTDHDVFWLQRDCGVYIVNLFDTHQAAVILKYPHRSLAHLLYRFCKIDANKVYQRADWRMRPLPEEFISYARQDSHSLLYIYDLMRNELIEKGNEMNNLITSVYTRSAEMCVRRYEKPVVGPESHLEIYRRSRKTFNTRQLFGLQALFLWRDRVAREQDESPEYVLPKHMLLQIAEVLPKDVQGVLACCNPIPLLVKTELLTIHALIREARQQLLIKVQQSGLENQLSLTSSQTADDLSTGLINKHDFSQCEENPSDLPVILNPRENLLGDLFVQHKITVTFKEISQMFQCLKSDLEHKMKSNFEISEQFISPYERYSNYLEMKPFLEGEKKKGGDQDRIKRIMDHFITLTANTVADMEPEADTTPLAHLQQQEELESQNCLSQPKISVRKQEETQGERVKSFEREITHKAIDSFLESARKSTETKNETDHMDRLLSHFRNLAGGVSMEVGESSHNDHMTSSNGVPKEETKKVKKRNKPKKVVLGDEVKQKKAKNKSKKRQSSEMADENLAKKGKLEEENVQEMKEDGEITESEAEVDGAKSFDYGAADYSIFQKTKRKSSQKRHIKEITKGNKLKMSGAKANTKGFPK